MLRQVRHCSRRQLRIAGSRPRPPPIPVHPPPPLTPQPNGSTRVLQLLECGPACSCGPACPGRTSQQRGGAGRLRLERLPGKVQCLQGHQGRDVTRRK